MTEMANFLYNPNKLNVALSRAMYKLLSLATSISFNSRIDELKFPHIKGLLNSQYAEIFESNKNLRNEKAEE